MPSLPRSLSERLGLLALSPLVAVALLFAGVRYLVTTWTDPEKAWDLAHAADVAANVAANGQPDTTISGRAGRARAAGRRWGCLLCRFLDWIDSDHCAHEASIEAAKGLPAER